MIKIGTALFEACEELEREKGISKEVIIDSLKDALLQPTKNTSKSKKFLTLRQYLMNNRAKSVFLEQN